jgi:hypothetical protein
MYTLKSFPYVVLRYLTWIESTGLQNNTGKATENNRTKQNACFIIRDLILIYS